MISEIFAHQASAYIVSTPVYEGPLDLLLQLIEHAELDITKLALAKVTDQYLEYIQSMSDRAAGEVSAFLVIAAKLLQIKSEALLPRPPIREEGEEDLGDALAHQLLIYKRFKDLSGFLAQREAENLRTHLRIAPAPKVESILDLGEITLQDLIAVAQEVLLTVEKPSLDTVVAAPFITIREKISLISSYLHRHGGGTFQQLLSEKRFRLDVVVTFLAMLELVKRHLVRARQEGLFGDIHIEPNDEWDERQDFELEFGE